jgi:hypothetical protein
LTRHSTENTHLNSEINLVFESQDMREYVLEFVCLGAYPILIQRSYSLILRGLQRYLG